MLWREPHRNLGISEHGVQSLLWREPPKQALDSSFAKCGSRVFGQFVAAYLVIELERFTII